MTNHLLRSASAMVTRISWLGLTGLSILLWVSGCSSAGFNGSSGSKAANIAGGGKASPSQASGTSTGSGGAGVNGNAAGGPAGNDASASGQPPAPNLGFGLLVNDLNCTFCHFEVHGTVVSVTTVPALRDDSHGEVYGQWLVSGAFNATQNLTSPPMDGGLVVSTGSATANYNNAGKELPVDPVTKQVVFPTLNFAALAASVQGSVAGGASPSAPLSISKAYTGNVILVGTEANPIILNKDILITGDLVIKGYYRGVGTIYVTGNIYIPANLKALHLASFPYSDTPATADTQAKADLALGTKDALGLATANNIFAGDLENYADPTNGDTGTAGAGGERYNSLYDGPVTDPLMLNTANGVRNVYTWLPENDYQTLYETLTPCFTSASRALVAGHFWGEREFSEIDAYLYAAKAIGGIDRGLNWTINGGMIAQAMHIISGAGFDSIGAATSCGASRVNFDYRMRNGLQVLEALAPYFPALGSASGTLTSH